MSTTIQIKRSSTASGVPLATDLAVGELAVNLADKRLYTKQSDGTIIELSTNPTDLDAATLRIDGVEITASATELNSLDGFTGSTAELNLLDGLTATTIELNTLDGITASTAELNKLDGYTGSTAELNILDGVTATTAEINTLDGITATTTELNYTDGVTSNIQTQLDGKATTAQGALADSAVQPNDNVTFGTGSFSGAVTADGLTVDSASALKGDVSFYEDTGTTAKMVWDASTERLGIGTASPSDKLDLYYNSATPSGIILDNYNPTVNGGTRVSLRYNGGETGYIHNFFNGSDFSTEIKANTDIRLKLGSTERMRIDSAGNVGIGTSSPSDPLTIQSDSGGSSIKLIGRASDGYSSIRFRNNADTSSLAALYADESNGSLQIYTSNTERARIDSSGNLLVGKTSTNTINTVGHDFSSSGYVMHTRDSANVLYLNRKGSDGEMLTFDKDGSTVGSIGSRPGSSIYIESGGTGTAGLDFDVGIAPRNSGGLSDNTVDLGVSGVRFKDLYLGGGVITASDYRLKEDIQPMQSYADTVKQMNLVNFAWKETGEREDGFIAHELQALVPSAVRGDKDAVDEDGNEQYQGVDPLKLIPVLTKALQEALERIEILENN